MNNCMKRILHEKATESFNLTGYRLIATNTSISNFTLKQNKNMHHFINSKIVKAIRLISD